MEDPTRAAGPPADRTADRDTAPAAPADPGAPPARRVRMGVVGLVQGLHLARWARRVGIDVVAACDTDPAARARAGADLPGVPLGGHWRDLLDADLDAVLLADDFDTHAAPAAAFLGRGVHVLSETAACADADQGRALVEAARASAATYSFAENYVLHPHVRLLRAAVAAGELGRVSLIEADYLHGMSPGAVRALTGDPAHWRGRIAPTAYCTHALSPILAVTGATPVEVTAFPVDTADPRGASVMAVRLSTGALALTRNGFLQGESDAHWSRMSVHGTLAAAESVRAAGERAWSVRVRHEAWTRPDGAAHEEERTAPPVLLDGEPVERGQEGTVLVLRGLRDTVLHGTPPPVGVREAVAASLVGVAGARSLAEGSRPVPVPLP